MFVIFPKVIIYKLYHAGQKIVFAYFMALFYKSYFTEQIQVRTRQQRKESQCIPPYIYYA